MKRFLFLLLIMPFIGHAQYYEYDYLKTVNKKIVFEATYKIANSDAEKMKYELSQFLNSKEFVKNVISKDDTIIFNIENYKVNYKKCGDDYVKNGAPIFVAQMQSGDAMIVIRDNTYKLIINNIISGKDEVPVTYEKYMNKNKYFATDKKYKAIHCIEEAIHDEFDLAQSPAFDW